MKLASLFTAQPWGNGNDVVFILNFPYHWNIPYLFRYLSGALMHLITFTNNHGLTLSHSFNTLRLALDFIEGLVELKLNYQHIFVE
jgi:hypothetical protein